MSSITGIQPIGDYTTGSPTNKATLDRLLALIPNPDVEHDPGRAAGSNLDEMAPSTAAQLRVEILAVQAAIEDVA